MQRGLEHAYTLCHRLAPDSPCWVTMHVDGEGGCVHAHATIANHDCRTGQVVNKGDTSLYAPRVQAVNDVLSRESGLSVLGADKERSTWAERQAAREAEREAAEQVPVRPPATEAEPAAPALAVEEAERRLYEARREMWDAEKALKAAERRHERRQSIDVRHIVAEHDDRGLNE